MSGIYADRAAERCGWALCLILQVVGASGVCTDGVASALLRAADLRGGGGGDGVSDGLGLVRSYQGLNAGLRGERLVREWVVVCVRIQGLDVLRVCDNVFHPA